MAEENVNGTITEEQKKAIEAEIRTKLETEITARLDNEFKDKIAKARSEEKDKVYADLKAAKDSAESLQAKLNESNASVEKIKTEHATAISEKDAEIAKLKEEVEKANKESENVSDAAIKKLTDTVNKLQKDLQDSLDQNKQMQALAEVAAYRKEKIKDLDESVVDLVEGDTKEEIDKSIEKAKKVYEKFASRLSVVTPKPNLTHIDATALTDVKPGDFKKMSQKEWADYRKKLFQ